MDFEVWSSSSFINKDMLVTVIKVFHYVHRRLQHLRHLTLHRACFSDKGLAALTQLTVLCFLSLQACDKITDSGLEAVVVPLSRQSLAHVEVDKCRRLTSCSLVSQTHSSLPAVPCSCGTGHVPETYLPQLGESGAYLYWQSLARVEMDMCQELTSRSSVSQPRSAECIPEIVAVIYIAAMACMDCRHCLRLDFARGGP